MKMIIIRIKVRVRIVIRVKGCSYSEVRRVPSGSILVNLVSNISAKHSWLSRFPPSFALIAYEHICMDTKVIVQQ